MTHALGSGRSTGGHHRRPPLASPGRPPREPGRRGASTGRRCARSTSPRTRRSGRATFDLIDQPPDYLVASTGMGMTMWLEAADAVGARRAAAGGAAPGPRSWPGARRRFGAAAAGLRGRLAGAVGDDGGGRRLPDGAGDRLGPGRPAAVRSRGPSVDGGAGRPLPGAGRGARLPLADSRTTPARRSGSSRRCAPARSTRVTFTSQPAVHHLFRIAEGLGRADELRDACNEHGAPGLRRARSAPTPLLAEGITRPAWPDPPRLAAMIRLVASELGPRTGRTEPCPSHFPWRWRSPAAAASSSAAGHRRAKVRALLDAGAAVVVIAAEADPGPGGARPPGRDRTDRAGLPLAATWPARCSSSPPATVRSTPPCSPRPKRRVCCATPTRTRPTATSPARP